MATLANQGKNTASLTNVAISNSTNRTWDEATKSWDTIGGTWDSPGIALANQAKNTASVSNTARS